MELPLELWKELFTYVNESERVNFIYCVLGEERSLKLPTNWTILLECLDLTVRTRTRNAGAKLNSIKLKLKFKIFKQSYITLLLF